MAPYSVQSEDRTSYSGASQLVAIERHLLRYNADIVRRMASYIRERSLVLECGAGIGTLAVEWTRQTNAAPECVEIDTDQRNFISARGLVCYRSIGDISKSYEAIYTSNVLEHMEDDVAALREMHSVLRMDGLIIIMVPAFMRLYSDADRAIGHYRRYERGELLEKVRAAGFTVVDCHFLDSLGFFAWLATRLFRFELGEGPASEDGLAFYDKWLYPISKTLDRLGLRHLFGKNLFLVARKLCR